MFGKLGNKKYGTHFWTIQKWPYTKTGLRFVKTMVKRSLFKIYNPIVQLEISMKRTGKIIPSGLPVLLYYSW